MSNTSISSQAAAGTASATQTTNSNAQPGPIVLGDLNGVLLDIQCGKYTELCCLANPQILGTFLAWRREFGLAKALELIHYACTCATTSGQTGGSGANPPAAQG